MRAAQLLDPSHQVAIVGVDAVRLDEGLVGRGVVPHRQVGAAQVVEQPQVVLLAEAIRFEPPPVPLDGQLRQALVQEAQAQHRAARHQVTGVLGRDLELSDGLVEQPHLAEGNPQVVMRFGILVGAGNLFF